MTTFLIKYDVRATTEGVRDAFQTLGRVLKVTYLTKTDRRTQRPFRMYFVAVENNDRVLHFAQQIKENGFMTIPYRNPYYLKIHLAEKKVEPHRTVEPGQLVEISNGIYEEVLLPEESDAFMKYALEMAAKRFL